MVRLRRALFYVGAGALAIVVSLAGSDPALDTTTLAFGDSPTAPTEPDPGHSETPDNTTRMIDTSAAPAVFTIEAPDQTAERVVQLSGWANAGTRLFTLTEPVDIGTDGRWSVEVILDPGPNTVVVEAVGPDGEIVRREVDIFSDTESEPIEPVPFSASQLYRASVEAEPYDYFSGTATPFSTVTVSSPYGSTSTPVDADGNWSTAVFFSAPGGPDPFPVTVTGVNGSAEFDFFYSAPG